THAHGDGGTRLKRVDYSAGKQPEIEHAEDRNQQGDCKTRRNTRHVPGAHSFAKEHHDNQPQIIVSRNSSIQYANDNLPNITLLERGTEYENLSHEPGRQGHSEQA